MMAEKQHRFKTRVLSTFNLNQIFFFKELAPLAGFVLKSQQT